MAPHILVVDDESEIRRFLRKVFEKNQFRVSEADSGEEALLATHKEKPDLITLDLKLPGVSGHQVCEALKKDLTHRSIPILIITASEAEGEEITSLENGADDFMSKPLDAPILIAHVKALLRRGPLLQRDENTVETDILQMNIPNKSIIYRGQTIPTLAPKEFDILQYLVAHTKQPISREILYQKIWGEIPKSKSSARTVDVHIRRLRTKMNIDRAQDLIHISGRGYMWHQKDKHTFMK